MQLHNLKKNKSNRAARQVGRGGAKGKTSGRGTKGQNARSGRKKRPELRDFIKRIPKLRGRGKNFLKSRQKPYSAINLEKISNVFEKGEVVNKDSLIAKGLLQKGGIPKILSMGEINKNLIFKGLKVSKVAEEKIKIIGGTIG